MKKIFILLLTILATYVNLGAKEMMVVEKTDGSKVEFDVTEVSKVYFTEDSSTPDVNDQIKINLTINGKTLIAQSIGSTIDEEELLIVINSGIYGEGTDNYFLFACENPKNGQVNNEETMFMINALGVDLTFSVAISGTITISNLTNESVKVTFSNVVVENYSDDTSCIVNGTIETLLNEEWIKL